MLERLCLQHRIMKVKLTLANCAIEDMLDVIGLAYLVLC